MMKLTEQGTELRVSKKCPNCGWRVLDKITPATGIVELKCPRCGLPVKINLSCRTAGQRAALRCGRASGF